MIRFYRRGVQRHTSSKGVLQRPRPHFLYLLADFPTKPVMGPRFHMLDSWYRNGIPWAHIPKLPVQPNSVFQMGISAGAEEVLKAIQATQ